MGSEDVVTRARALVAGHAAVPLELVTALSDEVERLRQALRLQEKLGNGFSSALWGAEARAAELEAEVERLRKELKTAQGDARFYETMLETARSGR